MKQILKIIAILLFTQVYAQNNEVIFTASIKETNHSKELKNNSTEEKNLILNSVNNSTDIEYKLLFNTNSSLFQRENQMKTENNGFNITELLAGKGKYFFDLKTNVTIEQKDAFGEVFLIEKKAIKWNLTNETKKIGNYLCKKATTTISIENSRGISIKDVIAWYAIEIPLNFGPKNYNGLPGLILKLKEGKLVFTAKKIILNSKEKTTINKPKKGKKITEKEFNNIAKELMRNR
ncbi:GLPGLI family protein [Tenacibaculum finnmarkense]|uniref:GLPGLI family protein n=1 Tax=Tenacibaculum finnmarkense TaxID=2781243 RepID=UPI001E2B8FD7|nr:GLPGLI family protein [Tenacibaculum finnmarkense]MCD8401341.1 GLPGLI family protein [Tenacibaculum finnmarkense genomovar ulcerans]MCD8423406.1 GLPGLI family protein [Tenacibaculum finnmarkense genomovar ulcerans]MCG8239628.1 GLPGLI family protein [Tenacibaculum finnmarkense genomovar ulcerans]MCG8814025.1 GLPGLI family protein [Tenacibaculum finnmarkense]